MKESLAYTHLKQVWQPKHPGALLQRVENSVGPGTPDAYACWRGVSAWFESKVLVGTLILKLKHVTVAQPPWWLAAAKARAPLFGALKLERWARGRVMLVTGGALLELANAGLTEDALRLHEVTLDGIFEPQLRSRIDYFR